MSTPLQSFGLSFAEFHGAPAGIVGKTRVASPQILCCASIFSPDRSACDEKARPRSKTLEFAVFGEKAARIGIPTAGNSAGIGVQGVKHPFVQSEFFPSAR